MLVSDDYILSLIQQQACRPGCPTLQQTPGLAHLQQVVAKVQQMHPLLSSTTCSCVRDRLRSLTSLASTFTADMSLTMTATCRASCGLLWSVWGNGSGPMACHEVVGCIVVV